MYSPIRPDVPQPTDNEVGAGQASQQSQPEKPRGLRKLWDILTRKGQREQREKALLDATAADTPHDALKTLGGKGPRKEGDSALHVARELLQKRELGTNMENGMALDMAEYIIPAGLPNNNAVAIGCGDFPEAVPWAVLTGGRIHGMDNATDLNIQHYLDRDASTMVTRGVVKDRVTYNVGDEGDARNIEGYNLGGERYGAAIIKHPNITNLDPQIYAAINATLIDQGLEVNGVTLLT